MLAHIFRPPNFCPSPVTSICSNNQTLVAFRRNGTCEFIESSTLKNFLIFELKEEIKQSFFLDLNLIIGLTATHKVILFDISSLELSILDVDASNITVEFKNISYAPRSFYYTNTKNELFCYNEGKTTLISSIKSTVTSLFSFDSILAIGTSDGWISILVNGKLITEIEIKTKPTLIRSIDINSFVVSGENGWVFLINPISEVVMDKIQIRENPLTAMAIVGSNVHISGVDSRITALSISKNRIIRLFQGDPHLSEVLCMCTDNGKAVSAGEDCTIVFINHLTDKYTFRILYDTSMVCGQTKDYFFTAFNRSADLYFLQDTNKATVETFNPFNDLITFKIQESTLEKINQAQTCFDHFLKIAFSDIIIAADMSFDQRYACISTSQKTYLYSLYTGHKLNVEKLRTFAPSKWVGFNTNNLVLQGLDKTVTILDLNTFETSSFEYTDFKEQIQISNNFVFLPLNKAAYKFSTKEISTFQIPIEIIASSRSNDSVFFLIEDEKGLVHYTINTPEDIKATPIVSKFDLSAKNDYSFKEITHSAGADLCSNQRYLFVINEDKISTYEIGTLISGIVKYKEDVVVVQTAYKHLSTKFKKSVFKEKFSNK